MKLVVSFQTVANILAKNIILAGVKNVTLYDPNPVAIADLSSQVCSV